MYLAYDILGHKISLRNTPYQIIITFITWCSNLKATLGSRVIQSFRKAQNPEVEQLSKDRDEDENSYARVQKSLIVIPLEGERKHNSGIKPRSRSEGNDYETEISLNEEKLGSDDLTLSSIR